MRIATKLWPIGLAVALVACQSGLVLQQAHADNPLREDIDSSPAASGSEVRIVSDSFAGGFSPSAEAQFNDQDHSEQGFDDQATDSYQSSQPEPAVSTTSRQSAQRAWADDEAPRPDGGQSAAEGFNGYGAADGPTVHHDTQVSPAAHYRSSQASTRPSPKGRVIPPPPIYRGVRDESYGPINSTPAPNTRVGIQPIDEAIDEPTEAHDRFRGPGGFRADAQNKSGKSKTETSQLATSRVVSRSKAPSRPSSPIQQQATRQPRSPRGAQTPVVHAPTENALKLALAGVSPSARPAGGSKSLSTVPAEQLLSRAHDWATTAESEDDYSRIVDACQQAVRLQRQGVVVKYAQTLSAWALNRRGQLRSQAGQQQFAMGDYNTAIRLDPLCWRAVHNRGVLLAIASDNERAFDDFNRTISLNPRYAKAYSNRAALFVVAGQLDAALSDYRQAVQLDPALVTAHRGHARVCHLLGKLDEALQHYNAAITLAPDDAYTVARRAELLTDLDRWVEAAAAYDRAIELDSKLVSAYRGSAWLLATCPDDAVSDAGQAIERAKTAIILEKSPSAESYDALAAAQASAGDFRQAVQTARRAIQLAPQKQRPDYQSRLALYQQARPYQLAADQSIEQASYRR